MYPYYRKHYARQLAPFAPGMGYATYASFAPGSKGNVVAASAQPATVVTHRRKSKFGRRTSFKQRLLRNLPAKHFMTNDSQTTQAPMTHNTIYTCNLTSPIIQGSGDNQRIGDTIHLLATKINCLYTSPAATSASCQLRLIVGWSQAEFNLGATFGSGLGMSDLFQVSTGTNWTNTAIINPKAFTVLDDRMVTVNNNISSVSEIQSLTYTVQADAEFPYRAAASLYGKTRNLNPHEAPLS